MPSYNDTIEPDDDVHEYKEVEDNVDFALTAIVVFLIGMVAIFGAK